MMMHMPKSTSRMATAKSAWMNAGMVVVFPLPLCSWAFLAASADAAPYGRPWAVSEEVTADRNLVIRTVPRIAKPRLAP